MPKHHHPGHEAKGFHDRTHLSPGKKALTKEQIGHKKRMAAQDHQEAITRALPHALQILARQREALRGAMAKLKVKHGSQRTIIAKSKGLEKKKKLLLKSALKTQKQADSYSAIARKLKELTQVRKQMADGEKRIREMNSTIKKHSI